MALLHTDSFPYPDSHLSFEYGANELVRFVVVPNFGRNNRRALRVTTSGAAPTYTRLLRPVSELSTVYIGIALRPPSVVTTGNTGGTDHYPRIIFHFLMDNVQQARLLLTSDFRLQFQNGTGTGYNAGGATSIISSQVIPLNNYSYIEIKYTPLLSATANSTIVRLNGVEIINAPTGTRTNNATNPTTLINGIGLCPAGARDANYTYYCDYYIDDAQFLGDVRVDPLFPQSNGHYNDWSVNTGTKPAALETFDGDTTFISTDVTGHRQTFLYNLSAIPVGIHGLNLKSLARKIEAGTRLVRPLIRVNGVDYPGPTITIFDDYVLQNYPLTLNPATNQPWTRSELNAAQFGLEVVD